MLKDATSNVSPVFEDSAQEIDEWLFEFHTKIRNSKQGQSIDLLRTQFIKQTTPSERLKFLSMLTFLYTAGGSRVGMSTPYGDTFWKSPLRLGLSPEYAYYQYMYWMNRRDAFKSDLEVAQHKNVVLTLGNTNIHSWNHHNMISAFLACDYETRGMNSIAKLVPEALGVAYESKDFVSHLKDGLGWKKSAQNFEQDTDRHRVGAVFGYRYCRYQ